jgi:putative transposase
MHLTLPVKLETTPEQADALRRTMERANEARTWIAALARERDEWRTLPLHYVAYYPARERFPDLGSNMVNDCIRSVASKRISKPRRFKPRSSVPFGNCTLSWKPDGTVSIWTVCGRLSIVPALSAYQQERLPLRKSAAQLSVRDGAFYLLVTIEVTGKDAAAASGFIGVDLGIVNLATDSDGTVHTGADVERSRRIHQHRRRNLQRKGTRSSRRKLQKIRSKQARYQRDVNHRISKALVRHAEGTGRGIALEDLKGIRERVTVTRRQRARHGNWGFAQLRAFITYKAELAGVPVVIVDPRNTSRTCPECWLIDKGNRPDRNTFRCKDCGLAGPADVIAATNIARAAAVQPMVAA